MTLKSTSYDEAGHCVVAFTLGQTVTSAQVSEEEGLVMLRPTSAANQAAVAAAGSLAVALAGFKGKSVRVIIEGTREGDMRIEAGTILVITRAKVALAKVRRLAKAMRDLVGNRGNK